MASILTRFEPFEFLPVRTSKTLVYTAPVDNKEALYHRIVEACQTICNCPGIFEWMQQLMMRLVKAFTESHGGYFEYSL
jgi:hypothetical protein